MQRLRYRGAVYRAVSLPRRNPYVGPGPWGEGFVIRFKVPQQGISQNKGYVWTGTGVKPDYLREPKIYETEEEAESDILVVIKHIQEWKNDFEPYITL